MNTRVVRVVIVIVALVLIALVVISTPMPIELLALLLVLAFLVAATFGREVNLSQSRVHCLNRSPRSPPVAMR